MAVSVRRPRVATPAINPTLARYLDDLRRAEQAAALDVHFGRVPPPGGMFDNIDLPDDPLAAERAVGAAPRSWLEQGDLARSMEVEPQRPLADMLLDNDRRRALVQGRLDRLTPEQKARSLPAVGQQYMDDLDAARASDIQLGRDMNTAGILAAGGLAGAGAFGLRMAMENQQNQRDQMLLGAWENERKQQEAAQLEADNQAAEVARAEQAKARAARSLMASVDRSISEINLSGDEPVVIGQDIPGPDEVRNSFLETPFLSRTPAGDFRPREDYPFRGKNTFFASDFRPPSPEESVAAAPGPESQVSQDHDLEDLPGPQKRSIMALMRGGIPEGRARDIILKGSSMSPQEYRMVTGGRR